MKRNEYCYNLFRDNWGMRTAGEFFDRQFEDLVKKYCQIAHIEERKDPEKRKALGEVYKKIAKYQIKRTYDRYEELITPTMTKELDFWKEETKKV